MGVPGPLDNLPRPLSERERGTGWRRRRASAVLLAGVIAAVGVAVATSVSSGPLTPVGAVQGAVESTTPPSARPTVAAGAPGPGASARPPSVAAPGPSAAPTAPALATLTGYRWPLPRGRLTLPFGPSPWGSRIVDGEPFHDGIDLATFCGDRIVAAHAGTVLAAGPQVRPVHGLGRRSPAVSRSPREEAPLVHAADRRRHRRRQRLPQRLCAFRQGRGQEGQGREGRPAPGLRGPDRSRVGLSPPLRAVQPGRDRDVRHRAVRRQADEAARSPDRAHRSDARPRRSDPRRQSPSRARAPARSAPLWRAARLSAGGSAVR